MASTTSGRHCRKDPCPNIDAKEVESRVNRGIIVPNNYESEFSAMRESFANGLNPRHQIRRLIRVVPETGSLVQAPLSGFLSERRSPSIGSLTPLVEAGRRRIDPRQPADQRQHPMPKRKRIPRMKTTTPQLIHHIHRIQHRHLLELANPSQMKQPVPRNHRRRPPDNPAQNQAPHSDTHHRPHIAALQRSRPARTTPMTPPTEITHTTTTSTTTTHPTQTSTSTPQTPPHNPTPTTPPPPTPTAPANPTPATPKHPAQPTTHTHPAHNRNPNPNPPPEQPRHHQHNRPNPTTHKTKPAQPETPHPTNTHPYPSHPTASSASAPPRADSAVSSYRLDEAHNRAGPSRVRLMGRTGPCARAPRTHRRSRPPTRRARAGTVRRRTREPEVALLGSVTSMAASGISTRSSGRPDARSQGLKGWAIPARNPGRSAKPRLVS